MSKSFITPPSYGLGDLVVALPVVQWLVDQGHETILVTRSVSQKHLAERIEGLAGSIPVSDLQKHLTPGVDRFFNCRGHSLQTDYWWGSLKFHQQFKGYLINDVLRIICKDLGIEADFEHLKALSFNYRPEIAGKVIFVPGSSGIFKCWLKEYWLEIKRELLDLGIDTIVLGEPESSLAVRELIDCGMTWMPTPKLSDAIDCISSCRAVVSVDTGLMHLAVQQGKVTVALFQHQPVYVRLQKHAFALVAKPCAIECAGNVEAQMVITSEGLKDWYVTPGSCAVEQSKRCMASILPAAVIKILQKELVDLAKT